MNSCELVTLVSSIACAIARECTPKEIALLSAIFTQLGDTLDSIAVNSEFCSCKDSLS